jgi:hypothetical protein
MLRWSNSRKGHSYEALDKYQRTGINNGLGVGKRHQPVCDAVHFGLSCQYLIIIYRRIYKSLQTRWSWARLASLFIEFAKMPGVDGWDAMHTFIRIPAEQCSQLGRLATWSVVERLQQ